MKNRTGRSLGYCAALCVLLAYSVSAHDLGEPGEVGQTQEAPATDPGLGCEEDPCCDQASASDGFDGSGEQGKPSPNSSTLASGTTANPIHLFSGRKVEREIDLVVDGVFPIRVERMYDSLSTYDSPLGYGWSLNFHQGLYRMNDDSITVRTRCGARDRYVEGATAGTYEIANPAQGRRPVLTEIRTPDPENILQGYRLTSPNSRISEFDVEGKLTKWRDAAGNELHFEYFQVGGVDTRFRLTGVSPFVTLADKVLEVARNYRLETVREVVGGADTGRHITLTYDEDTVDPAYVGSGRLIKITSWDGREVLYDHEEPGLTGDLLASNYKGSPKPYRGNLTQVIRVTDVPSQSGIVSEYRYTDDRDYHNLTYKQIGEGTAPFWVIYRPEPGQHELVESVVQADAPDEAAALTEPRRREWKIDWALSTETATTKTRVLRRRIATPQWNATSRDVPGNDEIFYDERTVIFDADGLVKEVKEQSLRDDLATVRRFHRKTVYDRETSPDRSLIQQIRTCDTDVATCDTGPSVVRIVDFTYTVEGNLATRSIASDGPGTPVITDIWDYTNNWVDSHTISLDGVPQSTQTTTPNTETLDSGASGEVQVATNISAITRVGLGPESDETVMFGYDPIDGQLSTTTLPAGPLAGTVIRLSDDSQNGELQIKRIYYDVVDNEESYRRLERIELVPEDTSGGGGTFPAATSYLARSFTYDGRGMLNTVTDARDNVVEFEFDDLGRVIEIARQINPSDANDKEITRFRYGRPGDALISDPLLRMPGDFLIEVESGIKEGTSASAGVLRQFIYSPYGHLIEIRSPAVTGGGDPVTTATFWVDTDGNRVLVRDAGHGAGKFQRTGFRYDSLGRVIEVVDNAMEADEAPDGNTTTFGYDAFDNRTSVVNVNAGNRTTTFDYDWLDRLRIVKAPGITLGAGDILETEFQYDAMGNVEHVIEPNNGLARTTDYEYDSLSRLTAIQRPSGAASRTTYEYDGRSRLYRITNARGNVIEYAYFNWGGLAEVHHFDDLTAADAAPADPPSNRIIGYSYDYAGNLLSVADVGPAGSGSASQFFSATGLLPDESGSFANGNHLLADRLYDFTYDALNRVENVTAYYLGEGASSERVELEHGYDARGNRESLDLSELGAGVLEHTWCYDDRDRLSGLLPPGIAGDCGGLTPAVGSFAFGYEPNDSRAVVTHDNGLVTTYSYFQHGPVERILTETGVPADRFDLQYAVDELLNVTSIDEYHDGVQFAPDTGESTSYVYGYDEAQRLTSINYPLNSGLATPFSEEEFVYDERGNRDNAVGTDSTYNEDNQLTDSPGADLLCYDADGNLETIKGGGAMDCAGGTDVRTFVWDMTNRLTSTSSSGATSSYVYDPFGRRIAKTASGTTTLFLWDGDRLLAEYDSSGVRQKRYAYAGGFAPVQYAVPDGGSGEDTFSVHSDHLDTPRALTDDSGDFVWRAYYSGYGEAELDSTIAGPLSGFNVRFPGQYYDDETGLHYNKHRYYDPGTGRYISSDPLGQLGGLNQYQYALNSPANLVDPDGLFVITVPAAIVATVSAGVGVALYYAGVAASGVLDSASPGTVAAANSSGGQSHIAPGAPPGAIELDTDGDGVPDSCEAPPDIPAFNDDPTVPPGDGYEWRGAPGSAPGSAEGSWYNPETGVSVHPDRGHPEPIGPHNDISIKGDKGPGWRQHPDGSIRPK